MPTLFARFLLGCAIASFAPFAAAQTEWTGLGRAAIYFQLLEPPPKLEPIQWKEVKRDNTTTEFSSSFPSALVTAYPENNTVPISLFLPSDSKFKQPFPVVVTLHYLGAKDLKVERSLAFELNRRGIASAVIALPYHLSRTPAGERSGELAIQPDVAVLTATMVQSILDVRRTVDQLTLRSDIDTFKIGISGISLGSLVAELAFGIEARFTQASFLLGGVDFAHILWTSSKVIVSRDQLRRHGVSEDRLRRELAPIEPGTYLEKRKQANPQASGDALVVAANFDTVIPPVATRELIGDLSKPTVLHLDTGHYGGVFVQRRLITEVAEYFQARDTGQAYVPPRSINAPTFRLAAQVFAPRGFDIGLGLDLFRTKEILETFSTLIITPRQLELFVGKEIGNGFALGAAIGTRGPAAGLFWSVVL